MRGSAARGYQIGDVDELGKIFQNDQHSLSFVLYFTAWNGTILLPHRVFFLIPRAVRSGVLLTKLGEVIELLAQCRWDGISLA